MTFYPKIMDLRYKDKYMDITLPIRVKVLKVMKFECPKHGLFDRNSNLFDGFPYGSNESTKTIDGVGPVAQELVVDGQDILCPRCFYWDRDGVWQEPKSKKPRIKVKLKRVTQDIYCAYSNKNIWYIDLLKIIDRGTRGRWYGKVVGGDTYRGTQIAMYNESIQELSRDLANGGDEKYTKKMYDVDEKELQKCHEDYMMRRVARSV